MEKKMKVKFADYLNTRLDEKLGNLNASNDPKYAFLLKAALKTKNLRGLAGPNSKIVTMTGKGRSQFVKDLRDVQKKMGDPQLVFLTTEYKVIMIKNDDGKWDEGSSSWVSTPIGMNSNTVDIFIGNIEAWDLRSGPTLPKIDVESAIISAKGNLIFRRLKNSLDRASLDDDTKYHAVVILPDPENFSKDQQRITNQYNNSDKYAVIRNGDTRFMDKAKRDADRIRQEREKARIGHQLEQLTFNKVCDLIFDGNATATIDGVTYRKDHVNNQQQCTLTKDGDLKLIGLYSVDNYESKVLVYRFRTEKFAVENK